MRPDQPWTKAEVAKLRAMRERGCEWPEIAAAVGRSAKGCQGMAHRLGIYKPQPVAAPKPPPRNENRDGLTKRPCLCCGRTFFSQGAHNRLCTECRGRSLSAFDAPAAVLR